MFGIEGEVQFPLSDSSIKSRIQSIITNKMYWFTHYGEN